jgi:hypothetical protein
VNQAQGSQRTAVAKVPMDRIGGQSVYDPDGRNLQAFFACCIVSESQGRGNGVLRE